jgi:hypothetical protein
MQPQLRPAMTPPSTSQTAPVTQAAFSEKKKVITSATSCGVPILSMGWKPLKPCKADGTCALGMKPS